MKPQEGAADYFARVRPRSSTHDENAATEIAESSTRTMSFDCILPAGATSMFHIEGARERRQLADFHRSGSVEAVAGNVAPEKLSSKMANTLSTSSRLHKMYAQTNSHSTATPMRHVRRGAKLQQTEVGVKRAGSKFPDPCGTVPEL
jgi:hypothetical protein